MEFGVFKVGSDLTLGNPSNKEISLDFKLVTVNKFSIMGSMAAVPMNNSDSNLEILIERIRVYRPAMGQPMRLIVDFKRKDGANIAFGKFGHIWDLSKAISLGEFINPNAPLNRQQAIAKLKEAKDLLELDMMSKEEFDALKAELSPNNQRQLNKKPPLKLQAKVRASKSHYHLTFILSITSISNYLKN